MVDAPLFGLKTLKEETKAEAKKYKKKLSGDLYNSIVVILTEKSYLRRLKLTRTIVTA